MTPLFFAKMWASFARLVRRNHLLHHSMRIRFRYRWTDQRILLDLFTEFADHVAVPKMLLGIKDRVEGRRIGPLAAQDFEIAVWMAAFLEFVAAIISLWFGGGGGAPGSSCCMRESRPGSGLCWLPGTQSI